jgi:MFS family permease
LTFVPAPLRVRDFRLLFFGRTVSMFGSAMAPVALAFAILNTLHGSPTDVGYVIAARQTPVILLLLFGGVLGDRLPRHHVMVAANAISGSSQAAAAALLLAGHAQLWELAALAAVNGASSAFFVPASSGVIPQIIESTLLQPANAFLRLSTNMTSIVGAAVGGLLVAATNPGTAIAIDAATFMFAATMFTRMRLPAGLRIAGSTVLHELREGWHDFWSRTWLWAIVLQFSIVLAALTGALMVLGPAVAKAHLGGPAGWGAVLGAQSVGLVLTGALMLRWHPRRMLLVATLAMLPASLLSFALARPEPLVVVVAAAFVGGICLEVFGVLWATTMQQEIPIHMLSRMTSYDALGSWALMPLGLVVAGPIAAVIGDRAAFIGAGTINIAAALLVLLSRDVRQLSRRMLPPEI